MEGRDDIFEDYTGPDNPDAEEPDNLCEEELSPQSIIESEVSEWIEGLILSQLSQYKRQIEKITSQRSRNQADWHALEWSEEAVKQLEAVLNTLKG